MTIRRTALQWGVLAGALMGVLISSSPALAQQTPAPKEEGLHALAQFLRNSQRGSASFVQTVTPPAHQTRSAASAANPSPTEKPKASAGHFAFERPNRFRFDYQKPFMQTIVGDGKTLWFYDPDLQQVTASSQAKALQTSPAALITSAKSVADLQRDFTLSNLPADLAPAVDGVGGALLWVQAVPKKAGGTLLRLRVGLVQVGAGVQLKALEMQDSFGQHSVLVFSDMRPTVALGDFRFTPPPGVAVLRQ